MDDCARQTGLRWLALLTALALLAGACGHKPRLVPPSSAPPSMPPGVSWGAPLPALPETGSPAAAGTPRLHPRAAAAHFPAPPTALPLPAGNYSPYYRSGEVWETGVASFYGPREQGQPTASGQPFDYRKMTAAHRLLPLGTKVEVTDLRTNKSVVVTINDRGPFWPNRVLDLSWGAAQKIGDQGLDRVRIEIVHLPDPVPPGIYTVQVGWFTSPTQLALCRQDMEQRLGDPVIAFGSDEGRWLRYAKSVHLDMQTATQVVRALRARHFPAYLVRLN
ncbi:MAG: septal ring lytic transglycosylase RlpA family protein [Terriglobales bacterium]